MSTAAKSPREARPASHEGSASQEGPASQGGRPPGRRPAWQRAVSVPPAAFAAYLVVRALVELATIHYNVPASYAKDWGGPSLAGVLAVHAGPGIAVAVATVWWVLRHRPAPR
jgi:hypothetical protein